MSAPYTEKISYLLEKLRRSAATPDEYQELLTLLQSYPEPEIIQQIETYFNSKQPVVPEATATDPGWPSVLQQVLQSDKPAIQPVVHRIHKVRWIAAASVIILLAAGWLWWQQPAKQKRGLASYESTPTDLPPGKNGAILTLENGSQITLDSLEDGVVTTQHGIRISLSNGQLVYEHLNGSAQTAATTWNTMSTPRGRQFQLSLPDGSKVWLNAASSIRYPIAFNTAERLVEITGEACFEIAPQKAQPFKVKINNNAAIEVLGTRFNVNAYHDETDARTTLLQGLVKVKTGNDSLLLQPGQQAIIKEQTLNRQSVDTTEVMAWKNGLFDFRHARVDEVMRQLARWYAIQVEYENGIPDTEFEGRLGRDVSLSRMITFFRESGVDCALETGNKLVIRTK